jgi:hypothetical protein
MPNNNLKEFIIQVLVHLDILVEPKRYSQEFIAAPINLKDKAAGMDDFKSL